MTPKDCSSCQVTAAATAPGATSRPDSRRAGAYRKAKMQTAMLMSTDAASARYFAACPSAPAPPPPTMDRPVVARTASPAILSRTTLRPRALSGFGLLLRGIPHIVFVAYWKAWATPRPPYRAPRMPTTRPVVPPLRCFGWPSSSPITGNWASAEVSTSCCSC